MRWEQKKKYRNKFFGATQNSEAKTRPASYEKIKDAQGHNSAGSRRRAEPFLKSGLRQIDTPVLNLELTAVYRC